MVTFSNKMVGNARMAVTAALIVFAIIEAAVGLLAWDIVYFLGAPRISVYWIQYQAAALTLFCLGFAGLMYVPTGWRGRYSLVVAGTCAVSALFLMPINNLYTARIGVPADRDAKYEQDKNLRRYAYLVDRYDENIAYYGPALESQDWMYANGYTHVSGLAYDRAFWVADSDRKPLTVARELAAYYADTMQRLKQGLYTLPYKKKLDEALQGAKRELDEFQRNQKEVEKNDRR